jgi:hypothetical protein
MTTTLQAGLQKFPCATLLKQLEGSKLLAKRIAQSLESQSESRRLALSKTRAAHTLCTFAICLSELDDALQTLMQESLKSPYLIVDSKSEGPLQMHLDPAKLKGYQVLHFVGTTPGDLRSKGPNFLLYFGSEGAHDQEQAAKYLEVTGNFTFPGASISLSSYTGVEHKSRKKVNLFDCQSDLAENLQRLLVDHLGLVRRP